MSTPRMNSDECEKILLACGFEQIRRGKSSHVKWRRGSETVVITRPTIAVIIWKRLAKEHNMPLTYDKSIWYNIPNKEK